MTRAADGLPARVCGPWTQEKLNYQERYARAFMTAMAPKRRAGSWSQLVYLDFLAGPGKGINRKTRVEFDGSPLRAVQIVPRFDRLYFADIQRTNVEALRQRIPAKDLGRVDFQEGDCHDVAERVVSSLAANALGLAFVDPEGFEVKFRLFQTLASRRIDVLYLFPGGIGVARNADNFVRRAHAPLDDLIPGWRSLPRARIVAGEQVTADELVAFDQPLVLEFQKRMADLGYRYSGLGEPCFTNEKNVRMYHLLFFSKHPIGLAIWRKITRIEATGQRRLF